MLPSVLLARVRGLFEFGLQSVLCHFSSNWKTPVMFSTASLASSSDKVAPTFRNQNAFVVEMMSKSSFCI